MSMSVAPSGFETVEEWIVHQLYEQPKVNHLTHTLFQQLERMLQADPSRRDTMNRLRAATGQPPLSDDHHIEEPKPVYGAVQYAVETLIQEGCGWCVFHGPETHHQG
jgi:hypothetical protein